MEYTVSATDLANIQLNEEDRVKEILRNVAVILAGQGRYGRGHTGGRGPAGHGIAERSVTKC